MSVKVVHLINHDCAFLTKCQHTNKQREINVRHISTLALSRSRTFLLVTFQGSEIENAAASDWNNCV